MYQEKLIPLLLAVHTRRDEDKNKKNKKIFVHRPVFRLGLMSTDRQTDRLKCPIYSEVTEIYDK
jgi:hypothetical protein